MSGELKKSYSKKTYIILALALVALGVWGRFLPHPPNFAPIAAIAIFGGVMMPKGYGVYIPLAAIILSDLFIGFHSTVFWTWGAFVLIALMSMGFLRDRLNAGTTIVTSLAASVLFFLVTNFGVWMQGGLYEPTLGGLMRSYVNGLPFFRNTLLGDLFYVGVLFGAYYAALVLVRRRQLVARQRANR